MPYPTEIGSRSRYNFPFLPKRSVATHRIERMAAANAVVMFSQSTCCMCHAAKRLFRSMGVSPTVYEIDEDPRGKDLEKVLLHLLGGGSALPVVFVGGKLVGEMDSIMASHINGSLVPLLKEAGALWL